MASEYPRIGPFCAKWFTDDPPLCVLMKSNMTKYCPGARKSKRGPIYITNDQSICDRSKSK